MSSRRDLSALPAYCGGAHRRWLYVAEFSRGVVKIGRTNNPRVRFGSLSRYARKIGLDMMRFELCESAFRLDPERELIARLSSIAAPIPSCREWFRAVPFDTALQAATEIAAASLSTSRESA